MAVRSPTAPTVRAPIPEPQIHETAHIHPFSNLIGDVRVGANVQIAPGTSIRADAGAPFHIGDRATVQNGAAIQGLERGRVLGDDGQSYSVWIGENSAIAHMGLIHGPAYLGDDCFIGFRSTVFNARINAGCVVMMHALIQDVEIPPGKLVPSGAVITQQEQANRLPNVQAADRLLVAQVVGRGLALSESPAAIAAPRRFSRQPSSENSPIVVSESTSQPHSHAIHGGSVNTDVANQVRQLLAQGYRVGTEHADDRRFQTSSWKSCAAIQSTRESDVLSALDACITEHPGEYVRLIGIDPKAKRRVLETIIQRPNGKTAQTGPARSSSAPPTAYRPAPSSNSQGGRLGSEVVAQVRQLLAQGARIGMEHADQRHFKTSSWTSCSPIPATRESDVLAGLEACMAEHAGEYVRLIGIDTQAKRRIAELIIQRPEGKQVQQRSTGSSENSGHSTGYSAGHSASMGTASGDRAQEISQPVRQLIAQGCQIGVEYADERRFKINSWTSAPAFNTRRESDIVSALESLIVAHDRAYIRLVGVDSKAKRRVAEIIVHRPGGKTAASSAPARPAAASHTQPTPSHHSNNGGHSANPAIGEQVRQLLAQSYRIGIEYADERRFKTSSWTAATPIESSRESEVVSVLQSFLNQHPKDYVRLIGIDPKAKRRVVETIIQKPSKK